VQIRIGNKQDEASVRLLIGETLSESGESLDLGGKDRDLRTIEIHYFGHDGVFLVAEEDRKIIAFAAAEKQTETACLIKRLCVKREYRRQGIGTLLLRQMISFARSLDYTDLFVDDSLRLAGAAEFFSSCRFSDTFGGFGLKL